METELKYLPSKLFELQRNKKFPFRDTVDAIVYKISSLDIFSQLSAEDLCETLDEHYVLYITYCHEWMSKDDLIIFEEKFCIHSDDANYNYYLNNYISDDNDEDAFDKGMIYFASILAASTLYFYQTIKKQFDSEDANHFLSLGTAMFSAAFNLVEDNTAREYDHISGIASLGGQSKSAKYQPLRKYILELYDSKSWPSYRNFAERNIDAANEFCDKNGIPRLSNSNAARTIASWVSKKYKKSNE